MGKIVRIKKSKLSPKVKEIVDMWKNGNEYNTDALGWYTGTPSEKGDIVPEQDADDL